MKRNLTIVCVLNGICVAVFVAVGVVGFLYGVLGAGILGTFLAVIALWLLAGNIYREWLYDKVEHRFAVRDYAGARAYLDRAERNHLLYPMVRIMACQLHAQVALALDDAATVNRYISRLRHDGGNGWKYRTAFAVILLNLDWGDISAARAEYEEFRAACAHAQIYKSHIEVLDAIFAHIEGNAVELPEEAKRSPYPVLHRVVRKYC